MSELASVRGLTPYLQRAEEEAAPVAAQSAQARPAEHVHTHTPHGEEYSHEERVHLDTVHPGSFCTILSVPTAHGVCAHTRRGWRRRAGQGATPWGRGHRAGQSLQAL